MPWWDDPNVHITAFDASNPLHGSTLINANTKAPELNNQALQLSSQGDHHGAIKLHREALALKIKGLGEMSIQAGITFNALGEELYEVGELKEAEERLLKARRCREGGSGTGGFDAAVTRENLGRVYEKLRRWEEAKNVRNEGGDEIACSNYHCPGQTFTLAQMKRCGACKTPMYCGADCQKKDWVVRHRTLCQARGK